MIKPGMKCKQVKPIEEYNFDYVNREFEITTATDALIMGRSGALNFGIERDQFDNYFELVPEVPKVATVSVKDGIKTIYNGRVTVVILPDGTKGVAKCMEQDEYSPTIGYAIAFTKAEIKRLQKELKVLCK